jgi:quinol monooxygenase YgiN
MSIHVSTIVKGKDGNAELLKPFLFHLVNDSRNEKACLQFDLFQCVDNENIFIINEEWVEQFWYDCHIQQQHVNDFILGSERFLEKKVEFYLSEKLT